MNEQVRTAYNRIAADYAAARAQFKSLPYLERLAALLPPAGRVLDLGCGAGLPVSGFFAERGFAVTGLDISPRMVDLARANVPGARFEVGDMLDLKPGQYAFDGIVSFYSVFHVAREQHVGLFQVLHSFLHRNGALLVTMGAEAWEGSEPFHGVEMHWSHYDAAENRRLLEAAGFTVIADEIDTSEDERHQVLIARP